jgi:hypothetical protein
VQAYRTSSGYIVGLAYSRDASWALNLLAAEGGTLSRSGHTYTITNPHRLGPEGLNELPAAVALLVRSLGIDQFIAFDTIPAADSPDANKSA